MSTNGAKKARVSTENKLLYDLEDYVDATQPDFRLEGDGDIERISSVIGQSSNNNILYVGRTGVGKSADIYGIVQRKKATIEGTLEEGQARLPLHMIDRRYLYLDTNTLFAQNDPDKIQKDLNSIFAELDKPGDHVLVIEDMNDWLRGIEDNQCQGMISSFMRELKKGAFQLIAMVRDEPGKNNLNTVLGCHSEMTELFTVLEKRPAGKDHVLSIMRKSKEALEAHHDGLHITDEANEELVKLTFQYPNLSTYMREQPARALRMRDQIASTYVSRMQARPQELAGLEADMKALDEKIAAGEELPAERAALQEQIDKVTEDWDMRAQVLGAAYMKKRKIEQSLQGFESQHAEKMEKLTDSLRAEKDRDPTESDIASNKTSDIKELEKFIRVSRDELEQADVEAQQIKGEHNTLLTLDVKDIRDFFSEMTGIPVKDLNADEATKVMDLDKRLKQKIYGQDDMVDTVAGAIRRAKAGLKDPKRPIGSFVMLGSSGVGKTYTAECLAEDLYGDGDAMTVFDMSEFMERQNISRLIGSTPGLVGYGEGGALTNAVRRRPHQVILLDEVEKAHPDVFKILLQVLDKGRLSDELGTVDFRNTVILMTTNLGQHLSFDAGRTSKNSREDIVGEVKRIFPQELINRVDDFMLFKALKPDHIQNIVQREIGSLNKTLSARHITVDLPQADITQLVADKYREEEGARQVLRFLNNNMTDQVAEIVLRNAQSKEGGVILASFDGEKDEFSLKFKPAAAVPAAVSTPVLGGATAGGGGGAMAGIIASMPFRSAANFAPSFH